MGVCNTNPHQLKVAMVHTTPDGHMWVIGAETAPETGARGAKCKRAKTSSRTTERGSLLQDAVQRKSALRSGATCKEFGDDHPTPDALLGCTHAPDAGGAACAAPNASGRCAKASHVQTVRFAKHRYRQVG